MLPACDHYHHLQLSPEPVHHASVACKIGLSSLMQGFKGYTSAANLLRKVVVGYCREGENDAGNAADGHPHFVICLLPTELLGFSDYCNQFEDCSSTALQFLLYLCLPVFTRWAGMLTDNA